MRSTVKHTWIEHEHWWWLEPPAHLGWPRHRVHGAWEYVRRLAWPEGTRRVRPYPLSFEGELVIDCEGAIDMHGVPEALELFKGQRVRITIEPLGGEDQVT